MMTLDRLLIVVVLIWNSVYTFSFGIWTWKNRNKAGAVMVFLISAIVLILPIYSVFFRE